MSTERVTLLADSVRYYSQLDEECFFYALRKIPSVEDFQGYLGELRITVPKNIAKSDLQDIIALFYRYDVDLSQLKVFARRHRWLKAEGTFWHERMFGT